ncbi:MAG TPA: DsrE family protein [Desulfuromonadaceae bacterium]
MRTFYIATLTILLFAGSLQVIAHAAAPNDLIALHGVKSAKGIFDINITDADKLPLYLQVIKETHEGLQRQGFKTDLIVAFRGSAVRLVSSNRTGFSTDQKESLEHADELIRELAKQGVRFEACAIATRLFHVDNASMNPEVKVVGNTFISLIGYQARGYAVIPIQ